MKPTPTFLQRLLSPTPTFWIRVQIIALVVLGIGGELAKFQLIPGNIYLIITGACLAVAFIAQCAIKDAPILSEILKDPAALLEHLPVLIEQFTQLHAIVSNPAAAKVPEAPVMNIIKGGLDSSPVDNPPKTA